MVVFAAPVAAWLKQFPQGEQTEAAIELDFSYLDYCDELIAGDVAAAVARDVEEGFSVSCQARADVRRSELCKIFFCLQGMNDSGEHINTIDRIETYLEKKYGVEVCYDTSL